MRGPPNLAAILERSHIPVKLSCILVPANAAEMPGYLQRCRELGVRRVAVRHIFNAPPEDRPASPFSAHRPVRRFAGNPVYDIGGVEVTHWTFEGTLGRSLNLFPNGIVSDAYLLDDAPADNNRVGDGEAPTADSAQCHASASASDAQCARPWPHTQQQQQQQQHVI